MRNNQTFSCILLCALYNINIADKKYMFVHVIDVELMF